jgi:hypothetical protein
MATALASTPTTTCARCPPEGAGELRVASPGTARLALPSDEPVQLPSPHDHGRDRARPDPAAQVRARWPDPLHHPGRADRRGADVRLYERGVARPHPPHPQSDLLEPLAAKALGKGRGVGQHAGGAGAPHRLRPRRAAAEGRAARRRQRELPQWVPLLLLPPPRGPRRRRNGGTAPRIHRGAPLRPGARLQTRVNPR